MKVGQCESQGDGKRQTNIIVVRNEKEVELIVKKMAALPIDRKGLSKLEKKLIRDMKI